MAAVFPWSKACSPPRKCLAIQKVAERLPSFVSAWLPLEDVKAENGVLIVQPCSHREPVLQVREIQQPSTFGQDPNHNRQECVTGTPYAKWCSCKATLCGCGGLKGLSGRSRPTDGRIRLEIVPASCCMAIYTE